MSRAYAVIGKTFSAACRKAENSKNSDICQAADAPEGASLFLEAGMQVVSTALTRNN